MPTIKAIIFDVDGTLYEPVPELTEELHRYWIGQVSERLRIHSQEATEQYEEAKRKYKSATLALSSLGLGSPQEIIVRAEHHLRPFHKEYLQKDRKLIQALKVLKHHYTLATLRNGSRAGTRFILSLLGFSARKDKRKQGYGPFDYIFPTVELGPTKPETKPFLNVLHQLPFNPEEIVVIGDRVEIDLAPAKQFGMKTVLVDWGRNLPYDKKVVDSVIQTIYEVEELIP